MTCGVCTEPGKFELQERELPLAAPDGWVLIDIQAVGICGTDYHILQGNQPFLSYPRLIGHELSGTVVHNTDHWYAGDLVVVNPYLSCGECRACRNNKPNCCYNIEVLGVHRDGGLCSRIAVPQKNLYSANGLSATEAAMVEFLAIGAHAVRRSKISAGDRILITGIGPIGIGTALFAQQTGAEVHLVDVSSARLKNVQETFGFAHTHLPGVGLLAGDLVEGFDAVFDATGNARAIEAGFPLVAHGGTYVLVSVVQGEISFVDSEFHKREMNLIGSRNALKEDFDLVIKCFKNKSIDSDKLCSETLSLHQAETRFAELAENREDLIKAIITIS